jgi:hypothetical protein
VGVPTALVVSYMDLGVDVVGIFGLGACSDIQLVECDARTPVNHTSTGLYQASWHNDLVKPSF